MKKCNRCFQEKDISEFYVREVLNNKIYYNSYCKRCKDLPHFSYRQSLNFCNIFFETLYNLKLCVRCSKLKNKTEFGIKNKATRKKHDSTCKKCRTNLKIKERKNWTDEQRANRRIYELIWSRKNRKKIKKQKTKIKQSRTKEQRIKQREKDKIKMRIWRKNNPKKAMLAQLTYAKKHPEAKLRAGYKYKKWAFDIKEKVNWHCEICQSKQALRSHHIFPWKDFPQFRYNLKNGICLCEKCHIKFHSLNGRNKYFNNWMEY